MILHVRISIIESSQIMHQFNSTHDWGGDNIDKGGVKIGMSVRRSGGELLATT